MLSLRATGRLTAALATIGATAALAAGPAAAASTEVVHPGHLGGDWHTADTRPDGTLSFETTYGGTLGTGAAVLSTSSSGAKVQLFTDDHDGTYLRDITAVGYATYQAAAPAGSPALPALNIRLDLGNDENKDVDTYLIYEPYQDDAFYGNAAIQAGVWQTWDAWHGGESQWWGSHLPECPQAVPCTIDALLALYPDAAIREDPVSLRAGSTPADADFNGSFGLNQGSGNTGVLGAADALHLATSTGVDVTYDFEPDVTLEGRENCKDGGWTMSTDPVFRNQGDCVSYFASAGRTHPSS